MAEQKTSKPTKRLFEYADNYKYLTIASWVLATVSAFIALVPFYYIWRLIKEVIRVSPDFDRAQNLSAYGWCAVGSSVLAMLIYMGGLICSHLAAFHVQATMRSRLMRHIMSLPLGSMDEDGSGKVRKIINESSAATETYLAHQLPDKCVATATPIGLVVLLLVFDWRLGLLSLIPVVLGFAIMSTMMGANMKKKMEEYQNALEEMSSEAVEYVRGIPVVKTFGQSVFSFKRFRDSIKKYEKWTIAYTKDLRVPMMGLTTAINSVFAILIAATFWLGGVKSGSVDGTFLLNLMSSPGAGKTTTLKRTISMLKDEMKIGVMEADIDSDVDAQAISETGVRAIQIHTGGMCHLDADMTRQGIREFGTKDLDFVVLENVGNLVCPAEFDTGSTKNAMILSVPEGDDKPLKYPLMFSICDVVLINKCDTLSVFDDFSKEAAKERILKLNPDAKIFFVSAKTGEGFDEWADWIRTEISEYQK